MTAVLGGGSPLLAQDGDQGKERGRVWRLDGLHTGFCLQLLLDPATLDGKLSGRARPLRADAVADAHPAVRSVVAAQPQFAGWAPSTFCLYYLGTVDVGPFRVRESNPAKAPLLGVWTVTATDTNGSGKKEAALAAFTNNGRLERAARLGGLDLRRIRSEVGPLIDEEAPEPVRIGTRYSVKIGKARLIWDGRPTDDSTQVSGPETSEWRVESSRRGPAHARLVLSPQWTRPMAGSLRIEGKDAFAKAIQTSPIRFVGPALIGGGGEFVFER